MALVVCVLLASSFCVAQVRPVNDYGALGLGQLLRRMQTTASVLMIGAHPDDEDSALLAYLARGENARTAYLSLTRGDGGQNIIGPELFEALGIIRTEELLQARRLDGAEQYFTRAFDYGFSKTLDEAKQKWPEDIIKCDVVRAIRLFRPQVVISVWTGTPSDGHGQHQYSGYISPIAVKAAADPAQCVGAGSPWQVLKFYSRPTAANPPPVLRINTGKYDPLLGRSYFEIAMEGRSQHRSQGEGRLELRGDQFSRLGLVDSKIPRSDRPETSIFDGLDTTGLAVDARSGTLENLTRLYQSTTSAETKKEITDAILIASGIQIDALAERETTVPGESVGVGIKIYLHEAVGAKVSGISWSKPPLWEIARSEPPKDSSQGFVRRETADFADYYVVKVPISEQPTAPYWLESARSGDIFDWPETNVQTLPFQPPAIVAKVVLNINGSDIVFEQPVQYRFADPARGEIRREFNIVPQLSISLDQKFLIVPASGQATTRKIVMTITNNSSGSVSGKAHLTLRGGSEIKIAPDSVDVGLRSKGEKLSLSYDITVPAETKAGTYVLIGGVFTPETHSTKEMQIVSYPHIQTHRFYTWAQPKIEVLDLKVAPVNVGYVMGSGDEVPEAIRQMGLNLTIIDDLATADLSKFETIVVGIRASEVRPDFAANNKRLLDYVNAGGNLIVQYQRPTFAQQNLAPFTVNMSETQRSAAGSTSRVVDENARVTILQPNHAIFNYPNKINDKDFAGWVQERNLYNLVTFDQRYVPLLESHDAGETPNNGGLVLTNVGKGTYIYTSYSWFRQLPAGVPGAYRIFANMISLPKASYKNQ